MDRFDRIYRLHQLLAAARHPVSRRRIEEELECSGRTVKRIVQAMRDYLGAPIGYDRERNGYFYDRAQGEFELPGLWFNASELQALLLMQQLLHQVEPGLLDGQLQPMRQRIDRLLEQQHLSGAGVQGRIRLLTVATRPPGGQFLKLAEALLAGKTLHIRYHARGADKATERTLSPQRLTRYRDNWYLEAWCHLRQDLRLFAIERIELLGESDEPFHQIPLDQLDQAFGAGYGIFRGQPRHTAILAFTAERARWIEQEQWHPDQQAHWRDDGRFELQIPFSNPIELILDILRYGPDVEVLAPDFLREEVAQRLCQAAAQYSGDRDTK